MGKSAHDNDISICENASINKNCGSPKTRPRYQMVRTLIPELLLKLDRIHNQYTSFPRGRGAFVRMFCWGARNWGFKPPVFRLRSGIVFEYSPAVATDVIIRELLINDVFEPHQSEV